MKTLLITLTIVDIVALVLALVLYLFWVSTLLSRIADNLAEVSAMVPEVIGHAETIVPDLAHANRTLGTISGALPLLYGLAEKILVKSGKPARAPGASVAR